MSEIRAQLIALLIVTTILVGIIVYALTSLGRAQSDCEARGGILVRSAMTSDYRCLDSRP